MERVIFLTQIQQIYTDEFNVPVLLFFYYAYCGSKKEEQNNQPMKARLNEFIRTGIATPSRLRRDDELLSLVLK